VAKPEDASLRTVVVAVAANLFVAVAKGLAALLTSSAAMLAETAHSLPSASKPSATRSL
jgi:divalent metal cation (Fe/Co/Zn/Cd) transporter